MKPENRPKINFHGKQFDEYQATQYQRKIESTVRKLKREEAAFRAFGDTQRADETMSRIRQLNDTYREFSKVAGLPTQFQRMRVYDLGK